MLLTKQQKYLLAVLEKLGCAEQRQLAAKDVCLFID